MSVKGFTCYETYYQIAELIDSEEQRAFYWLAIADYMFRDIDREEEMSDKITRMAFINAKSHLKTSKRQSENRKTKTEPNQNQKQTKTEQDKDKDKDKEKEKGEIENQPIPRIPEDARAQLVEIGWLRNAQ